MASDPSAPTIDAAALGRQLRERREQLGLAQDKLAEAVRISRVALQNIESGWSDRAKKSPLNPRLSTLIALCRELDGRIIIDVGRPGGVIIEFDAATGGGKRSSRTPR